MTIADTILELNDALQDVKTAITAAGGTVGDTGLAGLASEIETIPSGGGEDWGTVKYYSVFSVDYGQPYAYGCTVSKTDFLRVTSFILHHDISNNTLSFSYQQGNWWLGNDMEIMEGDGELIGDDATFMAVSGFTMTRSSESASISLSWQISVDTSSSLVTADLLDEFEVHSFGNGSGLASVRNITVPIKAVYGFVLGKDTTTIGDDFLRSCRSLRELDMSKATSLTTIGNDFLYACSDFNQSFDLPSSLTSIGTEFMGMCNNMTGTLGVGNLPASIIAANYATFATPSSSAPIYTTGITIKGSTASAWKEKFPNKDTSWYRKILIAN